MVSRNKLYEQLDALELELEEKIIPHLQNAANGKNDLIFCVSDFNPFVELKNKTDHTTEHLVHIGRQILTLKKKLGEKSDGSTAERICWYCREWGNSDNHHSNNARKLAKQFINELRKN